MEGGEVREEDGAEEEGDEEEGGFDRGKVRPETAAAAAAAALRLSMAE